MNNRGGQLARASDAILKTFRKRFCVALLVATPKEIIMVNILFKHLSREVSWHTNKICKNVKFYFSVAILQETLQHCI
jgi:hypothetical protein